MRTQLINDLLTNIFYNLIEMEDRIAMDEQFHGLTGNDLRVLSAIGVGEPKTMKDVGDYLRVKKQTVNNSTKSLVERGYAYKQTSPDDGRFTWIMLTEKGTQIVNSYRGMIRSTLKGMTGEMTDDQTDSLIQGLATMSNYLDSKSVAGTLSGNRKK